MKKSPKIILAIAGTLSFVPTLAHACAVCFGAAGSDMSRGFFWGIIILLVLPFAMMGFLFTSVLRATRKNKIHE